MQTIAERLNSTLEGITQAAALAHRPSNSVKLLAVSKTKPVSQINLAYEAGQRLFGENYIQEGVEKVQALQHLDNIEWHMIGPIQSNKTKLVAEHFNWVQSIDREKIARRLSEQRPKALGPLNVCIQVNIDNEASKSGVAPDNVGALVTAIEQLPNLKLRGLMAIPKAQVGEEEQYNSLRKLRELFDGVRASRPEFDTLSVGMSGDMHAAIANGSTMVRVGTAIFGART